MPLIDGWNVTRFSIAVDRMEPRVCRRGADASTHIVPVALLDKCHYWRIGMAKARIAASLVAGLLLLMLTAFAAQGDFLRSALANAFIPAAPPAPELAPEAISIEDRARAAADQIYATGAPSFSRLKPLPLELVDEETLWLARCIFSETKRPHEQELVAWVVRNRVETQYRGKSSYRDVVLDPMQFSAFNPGSRKRQYYTSLTPMSRVSGWQTALRIAHDVRWSDAESWRPFSHRTRHFYSEQSMIGQRYPDWASGYKPVSPEREYVVEARRFRFYEGVN